MDNINKARSFLKVTDKIAGFAKGMPHLTMLWTEYYGPIAESILKGMEGSALKRDRYKRDFAGFEFLYQQPIGSRDKYEAPKIPKDKLSSFPVRQPVFDYMYRAIKGGVPLASPEVNEFFAEKADLLNAVVSNEKDNLETYSVFFGMSPKKTKNLGEFIDKNKKKVWAQL